MFNRAEADHRVDWGNDRNVSLKCVECGKGKCGRGAECRYRELSREDYLWGVEYFRKYGSDENESVWGEWIKDQMGVEIVYGS